MSAEAVGYVYRFSPYKGAKFQVHHAIADTVSDQNDNLCYFYQGTLAAKARVGRQAANEAVREMERDGYLEDAAEDCPIPLKRNQRCVRFLYKPGPVVYDTRGRRGRARDVSPETTGRRGRAVARDDSNQSPTTTATPLDLSPTTTQNPIEEPKGEPTAASGGAGADDLGARAHAIVTAHWERCQAEGRPKPVLRAERGKGGKGKAFVALRSIVCQLLEADWPDDEVAAALWNTAGGHTLQGLGVELTKARARKLPASPDPALDVGQRGTPVETIAQPDCPTCGGSGWQRQKPDGTVVPFDSPAMADHDLLSARCGCTKEAT